MQMRNAVKVIIALLVILILLLTSILIITRRMEKNGDGSGETGESSATEKDVSSDSDTEPRDTDSSDNGSSDRVQDTSEPDTTTRGNETTAPSGDITAPSGFSFSKTLKSNTGTPLNLRAECRGVAEENGKVRVTVLLYLDYQSLYMGNRNGCRLSVGDVSETFTVSAIKEDSNEAHTQYLCHVEKICEYGETVSVYARFPFRGSYSDVELDVLEIDGTVKIQ